MDETEAGEESGEPEELDALDLEELGEEEPGEEESGQLDDMELELGEGAHEAAEAAEPAESAEPAGDEEVDALADMDIDSELADIEELSDEEEGEEGGFDTSELDEIDLGEAEEPAGDLEEAPGAPVETAGQDEAVPSQDAASRYGGEAEELPENLREEIKSVLSYMDQLLEALPEEKIQEFAQSEHFEVYKRLFEELGLEN
jgi:hypothetical protein